MPVLKLLYKNATKLYFFNVKFLIKEYGRIVLGLHFSAGKSRRKKIGGKIQKIAVNNLNSNECQCKTRGENVQLRCMQVLADPGTYSLGHICCVISSFHRRQTTD